MLKRSDELIVIYNELQRMRKRLAELQREGLDSKTPAELRGGLFAPFHHGLVKAQGSLLDVEEGLTRAIGVAAVVSERA
ncbi:MAG: hypothetical protein ACXVHB_05815 [Solirubrobacteraceae bacterium]